MALVNLDDDCIQEELIDVADYNIIPRPQELIDLQKRSSGYKSKLQDKFGHGVSKKTSEVNESAVFKRPPESKESAKLKEKLREKKQSSKHERKGLSKTKLPYKSPMNSNSPKKKYVSGELENKFESFIKSAMSSISKQKTEPSKPSGNESTDQTGHKDVKKIMSEPAATPQRRLQVLDARDNAIRSSDSKQFGSKKAIIFGCCPDMCPEKERYSRIAKNCLSPLELKFALDRNLSREDCHRFMVKEYSRSSADQQEPLPHELRPISMLMFTMDYLICNIMDISLETVTLADWYDFIWNRTRSIRKDITQQQLCDVRCVDIIEKCVRFHIHCAEALSEEDTSIFDPKINNENLTKCLQTLKHMYHDLQSRGIQCPNEAEFRSYDILLSLTEGETLRLVKDIRKDLLKSAKVKSAFEAALTFKSHNYVKFFNIIGKADYLSSCILHRYISEARTRALQIIVRAYSTQHNATMYPTSSLLKDLKFESLSDACDFCKCHGLESNENYITIQRQQFSSSPSSLPICRSSLLVGNKRNTCLGEVINNESLPANPLDSYKPHDSFDEKSILKDDSLGTVVKEDEQDVHVMDSVEDMETDEASTDKLLRTDSPVLEPIAPSGKSADFEYADIHELEERRTKLLSEINKLQASNTKNLKDIKSAAIKALVKKNKKDFNPVLLSKPHKSIMFSSEDSSSSLPELVYEKSHLKGAVRQEENKSIIGTVSSDNVTFVSSAKSVSGNSLHDVKSPKITDKESFFKASIVTSSVHSPQPTCSSLTNIQSSVFSQDSSQKSRAVASIFGGTPTHLYQKNLTRPVVRSPGITDNLSNESSTNKSPLSISKNAQFNYTVHSPHKEKSFEAFEMLTDQPMEKNYLPREKFHSYDTSFQQMEMEPAGAPVMRNFDTVSEENEEFVEFSNELKKQKREEELNKCAEDIADELYAECVQEYSVSICEEVFNNEKIKKAQLEDEFEMIRRNLAKKTILKWQYFCERKRQRRMYEKSTLCSPWQPMLLNTPYVRTGVVNPMLVYKKQCTLSRRTAEKIKQLKAVPPGWEEFKPEEIWKKVQPHPSAYFGITEISNFFKLCIIFPAEADNLDFATFIDWMCTKFSLPKTEQFPLNTVNTFCLNDGKTVVIVRAIQLDHSMNNISSKCLDGITSMILCVPHFSNSLGDVSFCQSLFHLLCDCNVLYSYPLYLLHLESSHNSGRFLTLLNKKFGANYFSDIKTKCLSGVKSFSENTNEVFEAINWLVEQKSSPPLLQNFDFGYYVEKCVAFAFNSLYWKSSLDGYKGLIMMPKQIIAYYNNVMTFRADALCSDLLISISLCWPPEELMILYPDLKIIDKKMQYKFKESMKLMLLPPFEGDAFSIEDVWDYVESIDRLAGGCSDRDSLYMKINEVLGISHWRDINWLQIIGICAFHLVSSQNLELLNIKEELQVYYTEEDIEAFEEEVFWQNVLSDIKKSLIIGIKRKEHAIFESPQKKKKIDKIIEFAPVATIPLTERRDISNAFDVPDIFSCQRKNLFGPVEAAVAKQREQTESFLHLLSESIISGNVGGEKDSEVEDACPQEEEFSNHKVFSSITDISSYKNSIEIDETSGTQAKAGLDWLDSTLKNKSSHEKSILAIADKISELKYNIQKCNILEDHFSQLLSKQV